MGHHVGAEISWEVQYLRKHTYLRVVAHWTVVLLLIARMGNYVRLSFSIHKIPQGYIDGKGKALAW